MPGRPHPCRGGQVVLKCRGWWAEHRCFAPRDLPHHGIWPSPASSSRGVESHNLAVGKHQGNDQLDEVAGCRLPTLWTLPAS